jgi:hypothetical protein
MCLYLCAKGLNYKGRLSNGMLAAKPEGVAGFGKHSSSTGLTTKDATKLLGRM